jgi:hypothetical protein
VLLLYRVIVYFANFKAQFLRQDTHIYVWMWESKSTPKVHESGDKNVVTIIMIAHDNETHILSLPSKLCKAGVAEGARVLHYWQCECQGQHKRRQK